MIKSGIKNYFVNLKYFFTPIGTLFVGVVIGLSILIPNIYSAISVMVSDIIGILEETSVDFNSVKEYLINSVTSLDWSNPIASLKTLISSDWLKTSLDECFRLISIELQPYGDRIADSVNVAIGTIKFCVGIFIFFSALGLVCGYFLTKFLVRRNMARRTFAKFILSIVAESVIASAILVLSGWMFSIWKPSIAISSILGLFVYATFSLIFAYIVYGAEKVKIKEVLNFKNIILLLVSDMIILAISMAFMVILTLLTNIICGILIGFAFVEIALLVISMNAENYVIKLIPEPEQQT